MNPAPPSASTARDSRWGLVSPTVTLGSMKPAIERIPAIPTTDRPMALLGPSVRDHRQTAAPKVAAERPTSTPIGT